MGYKAQLRHYNKLERERKQEELRQEKARQKHLAMQQKKLDKATELKEKIIDELNKLYALNKISNEEYYNLKEREKDIELPYIILGKTAFCTLAKSYIKGQINKEEFEEKTRIIIDNDTFFKDRENWKEIFDNQRDELNNFTDKCLSANNDNKKICSYCGKKGWLFSPVREYIGNKFYLCNNHTKEINNLRNFSYLSTYFYISSTVIPLNKSTILNVTLKFIVD